MVFMWRRDPRFGPGRGAAAFLPVEVSAPEVSAPAIAIGDAGDGRIEIALASGHRLTLSGAFNVDVVLRLAKRLERGRFVWPSPADGRVSVSSAQLAMLLEGIDWRTPRRTWRPLTAG